MAKELTLNLLPRLLARHLEPEHDLTGVHAHHEQVDGPLEELPGKDEDKVGAVAVLGLLGLGRADEQLGRRMDDLDLADDGRCVGGDEQAAEVVDDELVLSWRRGSRRSRRGPKEDR